MAVVRSALAIVALGLALAGPAAQASAAPHALPSFASARLETFAAGTAAVNGTTTITVGGSKIRAYDRGTIAFDGSRGHIYKLDAGTAVPGELIVIGRFTYSNENVQAALNAPEIRPWTKLDRTKLTARERASRPDELAHVLAPVYLAYGARSAAIDRRVAGGGAIFRARVDPSLVLKRVPAGRRALIATAIAGDYPRTPFAARFWVDSKNRIRRVLTRYRTAHGTPIAIDTSYGNFGTRVDTTLPPRRSIKDITPRR
jgi:hypothetical protein